MIRVRRAPTAEQIQAKRENIRRSMGVTDQHKAMCSPNADYSEWTLEEEKKYEAARLHIMQKTFGPNGGRFRILRREKGE